MEIAVQTALAQAVALKLSKIPVADVPTKTCAELLGSTAMNGPGFRAPRAELDVFVVCVKPVLHHVIALGLLALMFAL